MKRALPLAAAALLALGCLTPPPGPDGFVDPDPYETQNRLFFAFNDGLDRIAFEPLGRLWRFLTPRILRTGPRQRVPEHALPGARRELPRPGRASATPGSETLRFAVNSTLGVAGLWDASTRALRDAVLRRGHRARCSRSGASAPGPTG